MSWIHSAGVQRLLNGGESIELLEGILTSQRADASRAPLCSSTYMLLWPADGYMKKDDIVGVIDGSIFPVLAYERSKKGAFKAK